MSRATSTACSASSITSVKPGMVATPASCASVFDGDLVAHRGDRVRLGPMNTTPASLQRLGELGVLGKEAVARMHGLGAGLLAGRDDRVDRR